jgi:hypothetical protein
MQTELRLIILALSFVCVSACKQRQFNEKGRVATAQSPDAAKRDLPLRLSLKGRSGAALLAANADRLKIEAVTLIQNGETKVFEDAPGFRKAGISYEITNAGNVNSVNDSELLSFRAQGIEKEDWLRMLGLMGHATYGQSAAKWIPGDYDLSFLGSAPLDTKMYSSAARYDGAEWIVADASFPWEQATLKMALAVPLYTDFTKEHLAKAPVPTVEKDVLDLMGQSPAADASTEDAPTSGNSQAAEARTAPVDDGTCPAFTGYGSPGERRTEWIRKLGAKMTGTCIFVSRTLVYLGGAGDPVLHRLHTKGLSGVDLWDAVKPCQELKAPGEFAKCVEDMAGCKIRGKDSALAQHESRAAMAELALQRDIDSCVSSQSFR